MVSHDCQELVLQARRSSVTNAKMVVNLIVEMSMVLFGEPGKEVGGVVPLFAKAMLLAIAMQ